MTTVRRSRTDGSSLPFAFCEQLDLPKMSVEVWPLCMLPPALRPSGDLPFCSNADFNCCALDITGRGDKVLDHHMRGRSGMLLNLTPSSIFTFWNIYSSCCAKPHCSKWGFSVSQGMSVCEFELQYMKEVSTSAWCQQPYGTSSTILSESVRSTVFSFDAMLLKIGWPQTNVLERFHDHMLFSAAVPQQEGVWLKQFSLWCPRP